MAGAYLGWRVIGNADRAADLELFLSRCKLRCITPIEPIRHKEGNLFLRLDAHYVPASLPKSWSYEGEGLIKSPFSNTKGELDELLRQLDKKGIIIPSYRLNSAIENIWKCVEAFDRNIGGKINDSAHETLRSFSSTEKSAGVLGRPVVIDEGIEAIVKWVFSFAKHAEYKADFRFKSNGIYVENLKIFIPNRITVETDLLDKVFPKEARVNQDLEVLNSTTTIRGLKFMKPAESPNQQADAYPIMIEARTSLGTTVSLKDNNWNDVIYEPADAKRGELLPGIRAMEQVAYWLVCYGK